MTHRRVSANRRHWCRAGSHATATFFALIALSGVHHAASAADPLDEVLVTGSRIDRSLNDVTGPTLVIGPEDFERKPIASAGEVLQALPMQTGYTINGNDNYGDGTTRIDLRGLGPERTLILLNGRRFVFGGLGADASVDIDTIPVSLIERVEVSASGASTIYGADAVAGVVNVITRQDFSGVQFEAGYGLAEQGDGDVMRGQALFGHNFARGNLSFGLEFAEQQGVGQADRGYSAQVESLASPEGPVLNTGSLYAAEAAIDVPPGNALDLPPLDGLPFYTHVAAMGSDSAQAYRPFDPTMDLFNYAPYTYLQTPVKRSTAWLSGRYDLGDDTELFIEALAQRRDSRQGHAPPAYHNFYAGAAPLDPETGQQVIPATNYYNPFGVDVPGIFRSLFEAGGRDFSQQADAYRVVTGVRGAFDGWHWEGSVTWGRNESESHEPDQILRDRIHDAVGPSGLDAGGTLRCGEPDPSTGLVPPQNVIAGCVPLNLFAGTGADGRGTITRDQLDGVLSDLTNRGFNEQWVVDATLSGPFGTLPAGEVQWAAGMQFRRETGQLRLDPLASEGVTGGLRLSLPTSASFDSREVFVETRVPLLRDTFAAQALEFSGGARYSRFSEFGDATTLSGGLIWRPVSGLTLRGGYSEVFRAPSTLDLFADELHEITAVDDPCGYDPPPEMQANCLADGVPDGSYVQDGSRGTPVTYGGNPGLTPESGATWTAGVLFAPTEWQDLRASIDYWHVDLDDAIDSAGSQTIADECAVTGSPDACDRIDRANDGSISRIDARLANLTRQVVEGIDVTFDVAHSFSSGTLALQLTGTYLESVELKRFDAGTTFSVAGTFDGDYEVSWPQWRAIAALDWTRGALRAGYAAQYIDGFRECGDKNFLYVFLDDDQCRDVSARVYHDLSATLSVHSSLQVTAAIRNLADTDPPRINRSSTANSDPSIYRLLGRSYEVQLLYTFR